MPYGNNLNVGYIFSTKHFFNSKLISYELPPVMQNSNSPLLVYIQREITRAECLIFSTLFHLITRACALRVLCFEICRRHSEKLDNSILYHFYSRDRYTTVGIMKARSTMLRALKRTRKTPYIGAAAGKQGAASRRRTTSTNHSNSTQRSLPAAANLTMASPTIQSSDIAQLNQLEPQGGSSTSGETLTHSHLFSIIYNPPCHLLSVWVMSRPSMSTNQQKKEIGAKNIQSFLNCFSPNLNIPMNKRDQS